MLLDFIPVHRHSKFKKKKFEGGKSIFFFGSGRECPADEAQKSIMISEKNDRSAVS